MKRPGPGVLFTGIFYYLLNFFYFYWFIKSFTSSWVILVICIFQEIMLFILVFKVVTLHLYIYQSFQIFKNPPLCYTVFLIPHGVDISILNPFAFLNILASGVFILSVFSKKNLWWFITNELCCCLPFHQYLIFLYWFPHLDFF